MSDFKYPHLFEPIKLAGTLFRNRLFASPTGYQDIKGDGVLTEGAAAYYERKAMGGVASVAICEGIVDGELGRGGDYHICLDNPLALHSLARVAHAIRRHGAVASQELQHAGMYANRSLSFLGAAAKGVAYGPVECELDGRTILPMTEEIIERTINKFADAAAFAKQCGFGMVTIHAGHGWLLHQFLSPELNRRTDKWGGGAVENRARLAVAVCNAIRKRVGPGFPIEIRISGSECYAGGYDIDEGVAFAKMLDGHVDLIHVSAGSHEVEEVFAVTHPSMFLPDGCNVPFAAEIKKHVETPVATVGALGDAELMEEIVASGQADVVEMARALIADPDLPLKIRTGRTGEIRKCMRCLACFSSELSNGQDYCAINPEAGRDLELKYDIPEAAVSKKVLVAGGGIAGMQAALTLRERGHEVILCEKSGRLGGALRCEERVPFKKKLDDYLNSQADAVARAGVDLRLGTEVTPEYAESVGADVIISALGARPVKPNIPGIGGKTVLSAEETYINPEKAGASVAILGGGLVGIELGIYLAMLGRKVTIIEMLDHISDGGNFLHVLGLKAELRRYNIDLQLSTRATEITDIGVHCESGGAGKFFFADTVVYAVGQRPLQEEASALRFCAPEFYQIGDCVTPANIMNATGTAFTIARDIGRF
ncbi:2,4-dienoyl-CoA reductase [Sporobacter termitidis DSM 10068]|uniref:2,4-dienoyl-CoA reductase n=1 Tax=Sporobacter termitidis DSM 10068 TaxID=1123282 RepID=A0A1M5XQ82_9FIRM|nr:FAD-dependent oxidoreductase [Sporobacter termitidis]SHI01916.1 2,4-dienoyl-CoA reductase [Sporobacter termitidis DSM 10068]